MASITREEISRRQFLGDGARWALAAAVAPSFLRRLPLLQRTPTTAFADVRRGVGVFTGKGGTIGWLVNKDAAVVVDTQFPDTAAICLAGLQKIYPRPFDLLIDSHHHADHTAGNGTFKPAVKHILAQKNVPALQQAAYEKPDAPQVYADMTYDKDWKGDFGDETIALHYWGPGHTNGDSVIHFEKANVVHVGDLVFNYVAPYIDTKGGASTSNWVAICERMAREFTDETIFICGHGAAEKGITLRRTDVLAMRDFLGALYEYVQSGVNAGKAADELASIDALPKFESYSAGDLKQRLQMGIRQTYLQLVPEKK